VSVTATNWLMRRADQFEKARLSWRRGAQGELSVGALLAGLPDSFYVFNDVTFGFGNLDHIVIGPTGIFAVEVKACRGVVTSDSGEVNLNGERQRWIPKLLGASAELSGRISAITNSGYFVQGLLVFTRAYEDIRWGSTKRVYCLREERLVNFIETYRQQPPFKRQDVELVVRAMKAAIVVMERIRLSAAQNQSLL